MMIKVMKLNMVIAATIMACVMSSCGEKPKEEAYVRSVCLTTPIAADGVARSNYSGTVREAHEVSLGFKTPGQLMELYVKEGDKVRRGQLMARLDDADYKLGVEALQIQYDQLSKEVERTRQLFEKKSVSPNDYEKAVAGLKQLGVQLEVNKNKLKYTRLYAPTDGYVQAVNFSPAEMVDAGTPVFTLLDVSRMEVVADIPVSEYNRQDDFDGFNCRIGDKTYPMTLLSLTPRADGNQLYQLRLLFSAQVGKEVTAGMNVDVNISSQNGVVDGTVVTLPPCAVFKNGDEECVWVLSADSTVTARRVVVAGLDAAGRVKITDGLTGGESVVSAGVGALHEGQRVKLCPEVSESNVGGLM